MIRRYGATITYGRVNPVLWTEAAAPRPRQLRGVLPQVLAKRVHTMYSIRYIHIKKGRTNAPGHELRSKRPGGGVSRHVEVRQSRQQRSSPLARLTSAPGQGDDELRGGALAEAEDVVEFVRHPLEQLPIAHCLQIKNKINKKQKIKNK